MPDRYKLFGLCVAADIALPELVRSGDDQIADVEIRCGALPDGLAASSGASMAGAAMVLNIPGVARYLITDGRNILVEAIAGASERNVRLFLLGSAFGALLHQRGLLPLHANAIEVDGRAIGFLGHSGAGKSTIAAWFHDRGHPILADDVCVVTFGDDGRPLAHPGIPRFRLWRDALERRGDHADRYQRSFDGMDKYDVPTSLGPTRGSIALDRLYLLGRSEPDSALPAIRRLSGVATVDALIANTYRGGYLQMMGGGPPATPPPASRWRAQSRSTPPTAYGASNASTPKRQGLTPMRAASTKGSSSPPPLRANRRKRSWAKTLPYIAAKD